MGDLYALCRLCAIQKSCNELIYLQTSVESSQKLIDKLKKLNVNVDFTDSKLPKTICFLCIKSLQSAFCFVIAIEKAQEFFTKFMTPEKKGLKYENNVCILSEILTQQLPVNKENEHSKSNTNHVNESYWDEENESGSPDSEPIVLIEKPETTHLNNKTVSKHESTSKDIDLSTNSSNKTVLKQESTSKDINLSITLKVEGIDNSDDQLKSWNDYTWQCRYCDEQFSSVDDLREHSMSSHSACNPYHCTECKERKNKETLETFLAHVKQHRKYLHLCCFQCPQTFTSIQKAVFHKSVHNIESKYVCAGCNTVFSNELEYENHVKIYYKKNPKKTSKRKIYTCTVCNKVYNSLNGLNHHSMASHTERTRDYTCNLCDKRFYDLYQLNLHSKLHSDERPYQCQVCKFAFKCPHRLRQHVKIHFKKKELLCAECGKCFREKKQLARHMTLHADVLPHSCANCGKKFRNTTYLVRHMRQHTGETPYSCDVCKRQFRDRANRFKHMKRKHGIDETKRKFTSEGLLAVDPETGKVIYPEKDRVLEWKKVVLKRGDTDKLSKFNDKTS